MLTIGLHNLLKSAGHLEWTIALAVVAHVVLEVQLLLGHLGLDNLMHGILVSKEHQIQGPKVRLRTEPSAELLDPNLGKLDRCHDSLEITAVPVRLSHVVENKLLKALVEHALTVQLDGRNGQTLLKNFSRIVRHTAGNHTAYIRHVAEHGSPSHVGPLVIDRAQDQPVIQMAHRTVASVRVTHHDHIAVFDGLGEPTQKGRDKGTELANNHISGGVGDHRELVMLLTNSRAHGGPIHNGVHLEARGLQRILDDLQRDLVWLTVELPLLYWCSSGVDDNHAESVDLRSAPSRHKSCRIQLHNDCRSGNFVASQQL
mmetsp:Transcript_33478/g.87040  ORF Transcript_33478/g.87040 Transcript_33478/m.87040 type:complete len:315 (-) Transcript_33478:1957-2901(-)